MTGLLDTPLGAPGSGRARYGRAMALYREGQLTPAQLEAYRTAAADDHQPPAQVLQDRGLPLPADAPATPESAIHALVEECDIYLSGLPGPGVAEARAGLARWRGGPVAAADPAPHDVVDRHLPDALRALAATHPALADAIAAACSHLRWTSLDRFPRDGFGGAFTDGHAFASLMGAHAQGFDLGLFLIAPHLLLRDHHHPAPALYAPLTGPHGWRFGPERPLLRLPAHRPVWTPPGSPLLTKVGPIPFLCLFVRTRDAQAPAQVIPATDWPRLEAMRL